MMVRQILIATLLVGSLMVVTCDWFEEPEAIEPDTQIISCPGDQVMYGQPITIQWVGYAFGAEVLGYDWSLDESPWERLSPESTMIGLDSLPVGRHCFRVRTVDSRGLVDGRPDSCCFDVVLQGVSSQRAVLVEIFTTTWCRNCPNAEKALKQIVDSMGDSVVVVAYHGTPDRDGLASEETQNRIDWYWHSPSFPGEPDQYPTALFDGLRVVQGAESVDKAKSDYQYEIRERLQIGSPLRIEIEGDLSAEGGHVEVEMHATDRVDRGSLRLEIVVVEMDVKYQGYFSKEFAFVVRDLLDPATISISAVGDSVRVERNFSIAPNWVIDNLQIVAFVQDAETREVIQAARFPR